MFKINDFVKINSTHLSGKITRIKESKNEKLYTVTTSNNSNIIVSEKNLTLDTQKKVSNSNSNRSTTNNVTIKYSFDNTSFSNEIMLRHQTVEVALENLDKFISQALCNKEKRIRIIHGRHGGILRNAVHEYLEKSPFVEKYELGQYYEGSIGVTVAYLK